MWFPAKSVGSREEHVGHKIPRVSIVQGLSHFWIRIQWPTWKPWEAVSVVSMGNHRRDWASPVAKNLTQRRASRLWHTQTASKYASLGNFCLSSMLTYRTARSERRMRHWTFLKSFLLHCKPKDANNIGSRTIHTFSLHGSLSGI